MQPTIFEFRCLNTTKKIDLILMHGDAVGNHTNGNIRYVLYALFDFYAELAFISEDNSVFCNTCYSAEDVPNYYIADLKINIDLKDIFAE